jgi:hypothetical protein
MTYDFSMVTGSDVVFGLNLTTLYNKQMRTMFEYG